MKAIVGLGNPGIGYEGTRHNVGFLVLDQWSKGHKLSYKSRFRGKFAEERVADGKVLLLKPQTYMNLSGMAVAEMSGFYQLDPRDILIVHDDIDLALGKLRLRAQGSAGGHNGLKSIQTHLGTTEYWRLKIGVGRPGGEDVAEYVLSPFAKAERKDLEEVVAKGVEFLELWLRGQAEETTFSVGG
ncbi:MAG: aminoacyl-tRNA hydrolase [Peptococcaceae bacterium]|nr:aminoacyl-tRNA hydrolase [Peptococcaceae bacterium]